MSRSHLQVVDSRASRCYPTALDNFGPKEVGDDELSNGELVICDEVRFFDAGEDSPMSAIDGSFEHMQSRKECRRERRELASGKKD